MAAGTPTMTSSPALTPMGSGYWSRLEEKLRRGRYVGVDRNEVVGHVGGDDPAVPGVNDSMLEQPIPCRRHASERWLCASLGADYFPGVVGGAYPPDADQARASSTDTRRIRTIP